MRQPPILEHLRIDHVRMAQIRTVLEHQMRRFSTTADGPDFGLLQELVDYISEYPDTIHHPLEDRLFEHVLRKGVTPAERQLIGSNFEQHVEIKERTRKLSSDVQAVLNGAVVPADRLQADVTAYVELQLKHMLVEERQLFPLADRLFSMADWRTIEAELGENHDPLVDRQSDRFANLFRYILEIDRLPATSS